MDLKDILSSMTTEIRENLARAVEIGRWPDGTQLTDQQKASSMQAIIAWDATYGEQTDEPFKVQKGGELNRKVKKSTKINDQDSIKTINIDS